MKEKPCDAHDECRKRELAAYQRGLYDGQVKAYGEVLAAVEEEILEEAPCQTTQQVN